MENFSSLELPEALNHTLQHMQFEKPTPIQAEAIPYALAGKDILGSAQTGTGKTAAFAIPLVAKLMSKPTGSALIMTPTRELALQVVTQVRLMLGKKTKVKAALLIGGESMPKQLNQLKQKPRIIVGTPGRINDHLERGTLNLSDTEFLVLDETDRMLDMGFSIQIDRIIKCMPKERQTLLFSATLPHNIVNISKKYLQEPVRISVDPESVPALKIKHDMVNVTSDNKYDRFLAKLEERDGSIIVFVNTKRGTDKLARNISKLGYKADVIHGDLRQRIRDKVIANFRKKKYRILVATDVAARGLDIPHIEHVINYDIPQCAEDYIHRIGRTARAGAEGEALAFVTPADKMRWYEINKLMNPHEKHERPRGEGKKSNKKRHGFKFKGFGKAKGGNGRRRRAS